MDDSEATSLEQIRAFLAGSGEVRFAGQRREEVYAWVEKTLVRHRYASLDRAGKGLLRRYLERMTGLSRAQVTRLIRQHQLTGRVQAAAYQRNQFARRYTSTDLDLLAYVDKAHGNLSGPATKHILNREFEEFGIAAYQRLAGMPGGDAWRGSRWRTCTGYATRQPTASATRPISPRGPRRFPSASGASRSPTARPDTCASTPCIRAIRMAARVCVTSTPWTR